MHKALPYVMYTCCFVHSLLGSVEITINATFVCDKSWLRFSRVMISKIILCDIKCNYLHVAVVL